MDDPIHDPDENTSSENKPADFFSGRAGDLSGLRDEFRSVQLGKIAPLAAWLNDRPWNLLWVRWFLFFALFPLVLTQIYGGEGSTIKDAAWALGSYFALLWLVILNAFMRPGKMDARLLAQVMLFTVLVGILLVLLIQRLPGVNLLYQSARSDLLIPRWFGFVCGVGVVEEAAKALPVYLFVFRAQRGVSPVYFAFVGVVSGLAFGVAEAVSYSYLYARDLVQGEFSFGSYIIIQFLRLISLPLLHACWCGVSSYFIGLASVYPRAPRALLIIGLLLAALLHGTFDAFSGSWISILTAAISFLIFVSYVRTGTAIASELAEIAPRSASGESTTS